VLTYVYDDVSNRSRLWESSAGRYTYSYDENNRLTRIINTGSVRTTFVYNAAGQRTVLRQGNGTRTSYSYDAAGQTTQIFHRRSNATSLLQLDYRYDTAGNRQVMIEGAGTARVTWLYDDQNQLTGENRTGANAYRNTFTFDAAGNRTLKNAGGTRTTYSYDMANQLTYALAAAGRTTYTFDAAGNQRAELTPTGARITTTWNYENQPTVYQLSTGSRVTMSYNADNRRTQKQTAATVSTKFIWEPTTDAYFSELNNSNTNQKLYTFEPVQYGNLISQRVGGDHYVHADALGSTRALSSTGTTVSDTFLYDAWGNEVARTGTTAIVPFKWVGGVGYYYDTETGFYYVRARVHQPTLARWTSVDPFESADFYRYVMNAPINLLDPSGLVCCGAGKKCEILFGPDVTGPTLILINPNLAAGNHKVGFKWTFSVSVGFETPCDCCSFQQFIGCTSRAYFKLPSGQIIDIDLKDHEQHPADRELEEDCRIVGGTRRCYGDRETYKAGDGDDTVTNEWRNCSFYMRDSPEFSLDFAPPNDIPMNYKGGKLLICRSCKVNQIISSFDPETKTSVVIWSQVHELNECRVIRIQ
jgi:RHS repeat-associated protein